MLLDARDEPLIALRLEAAFLGRLSPPRAAAFVAIVGDLVDTRAR
jgi:hypothetical protein